MANKIKEIKGFFSGIISSFSSSDIKDDAASYSENIDSTDEDGVLKGSKEDSIEIENSSIKASTAKTVENNDNTFDLLYADYDTGKINVIEDLYGTKSVQTPVNASEPGENATSMVVKNNQAFVGYGKNVEPKIVYKTKHKPFAESDTNLSNWIYEKSTVYDERLLNSSFNIDRFLALPSISSTNSKDGIGIRYDHKDIYFVKFKADWDNTNDVYDFNANPAKIIITGGKNVLGGAACDMCQANVDSYENDDNYKFWVLSNSGGDTEDTNSFPIVEKYEYTTLYSSVADDGTPAISNIGNYTVNFNGNNPPNGSAPATILETKNKIWIQYWKPNGDKFDRKENFLWCADKPSVDSTSGELSFENKSLHYDYIKKCSQKFRLTSVNWGAEEYEETYFRNQDKPYHNLNNSDWCSGDSDWGDGYSKRGGHYLSGFYMDTNEAPSLRIARHGLTQSPLTDNPTWNSEETGAIEQLNTNYNLNIDEASDEDWVSIIGQFDDKASVNIYTAEEYKVDRAWWKGGDYRRLRASDDNGNGSDNLDDKHNFINFLYIVGAIFAAIMVFLGSPLASILILTWMVNLAANLFEVMYDGVNWFYNGKCFEGAQLQTVSINISSNHNPNALLNVNTDSNNGEVLDSPARIQLRNLSGFDNNLDIIAVKHYYNRLIVSAYNPNEENILERTKLIMFNTSMHSLTEDYPLPVLVLDQDVVNQELSDEQKIIIPDDYIEQGTSTNLINNKISQRYHPIVDFNVHPFGTYDFQQEDLLEEIYPHLNIDFWNEEEISINTSNLVNSSTVGKIYNTDRATFDIFLRNNSRFDGRTIVNARPSWSNQTNQYDHIGFMSTSGPLNISKFTFLTVGEDDASTDNSQIGLPLNPHLLFPDNKISILSINQTPNTSDDTNIKSYSLSTKAISFNVKAQTYDGASIAPFIYSNEEGNLNLYRYKINLVYDGYQDSPLSNHYTEVDIRDTNVRADGYTLGSGTTAQDDYEASSLGITVNLHKPELISRRVTHVRLWRSTIQLYESDTESDTFNVEGAYTLVETIPLKSNWVLNTETVPGYNDVDLDLGEIAYYRIVDNGNVGVSYEAYVGLPEAMKKTLPKYTLSTQLNGFLYIANCKHLAFDDASALIFRSLPDKYSMFDWTKDFLALPSKPRALTSFDGRLIVWDYDNMYVINPEGFYIEDTFEGSGCLGSESFDRNEQGICFADENNIYLYDGKNVNNIGIPIITNNNYKQEVSWRNRSLNYDSIIKYNSVTRAFCVFFKLESTSLNNWVHNSLSADSLFNASGNTHPEINRWHDIQGSLVDWELAEEQPRYIVHRAMRDAWVDSETDYIPQDQVGNEEEFFADYIYDNITIPYGCLYDKIDERYIVDMPLFLYGKGNYTIDEIGDTQESYDNVIVLEKLVFPDIEDIIDINGNLALQPLDAYYIFTYNSDKKRWDLQTTNEYKGAFNGPKGEIYSSQIKSETEDTFVLKELFKTNTVKQFNYTSKTFSLSNQTVNKILSRLKIFYKYATPEFEYMINNDDKWIVPVQDNITYENYCLSYKFPKEHKKAKTIKLKFKAGFDISNNSYNTEIDSFSIIYRERGNV